VPQHQVTSEVGPLRTVLLHRPGAELKRLTPRNNADLLFDGLPWVARAQEEHDAFAEALRNRDVEVLYLSQLLEEAFEDAVKDRAFEAATEVEWRGVDETRRWESLESTAGDAVAAAMTAADVADSIDKALEVADAAKKLHKVGKAVRKIRR